MRAAGRPATPPRSRPASTGRPVATTGAIERSLQMAGYRRIAKGRRFFVTGRYGPLREGELEAARAWATELAHALEPKAVAMEV